MYIHVQQKSLYYLRIRNAGSAKSTAFLVKVKEEEIVNLRAHIADLERSLAAYGESGTTRKKSRLKPESIDANAKRGSNQNELLSE